MRALLVAFSLVATGCVGRPIVGNLDPLFADELFPPPAVPVDEAAAFAVSPDMRAFIDDIRARAARSGGSREALYAGLMDRMHVDYDATVTRTAAETFSSRTGNCLSLALLAGALARELEIEIQYQVVHGQDTWTRADGMAYLNRHLNVVLERRGIGTFEADARPLTIDFLRVPRGSRQLARAIDADTVRGMYLNNRAAELLAEGRTGDAYWWSRAAVERAPLLAMGYNTLAMVYLRQGHADRAEAALRRALEHDPQSAVLLSNLVIALQRQGRPGDAHEVQVRLERIQPHPPFHFMELGKAALAQGDNEGALELFEEELARIPYDHELLFLTALAEWRLGELRSARKHFALAQSLSPAGHSRALYAAKLARLEAAVAH